MKRNFNQKKGITLIALVVTIIVLLLLAGVSISMLTGQNGILTRAAESKVKTEEAETQENERMQGYEDVINQYAGGKILLKDVEKNPEKYLEKAKTEKKQTNEYFVGIDADGNIVNMDAWRCELTNDKTGVSVKKYNTKYDDGSGRVTEKLPQYVCYLGEKNEYNWENNSYYWNDDTYYGSSNTTYYGNNNTYYGSDNTYNESTKRTVYEVTELDGTFDCSKDDSKRTALKEFPEIPKTVTRIGTKTFFNCEGLTNINIPNNVKSIGKYVFCGCRGLTSVNIPDSITSISEGMFMSCTGLTKVDIPSSVTNIGVCAFTSSGLESINIPNSVTSIEQEAFEACSSLTSVNLPTSLNSIDYAAFSYCIGLTSINIPGSVTSIGRSAFNGCGRLTLSKDSTLIIPSDKWGAKEVVKEQ